MTFVRLEGFKIFRDRHGKMRCYHRKTGHKVDLQAFPLGSAEFFAECEAIRAIEEAQKTKTPKAGTLGALMEHFEQTQHFCEELGSRVQDDYRWCRDKLASIASTPVNVIDTPLIAGIHDKISERHGYRRGNYIRTYLSEVFKYAIPAGLIEKNFAANVIIKKRPKQKPKANPPWNLDEIYLVLPKAPPHLRAAIGVMLATGLDPSDAITLPKTAIEDNVVWDWRNKTEHEQAIPIGPLLQAILNRMESHTAPTLLANSRGQSWTYSGLASSWHKFRRKLVEEGHDVGHLTLKALRHTLATSLREEGQDERAIADILGQKTPAMARHYSRNAALAKKNKKTLKSIRKREKRLAEFVKPSPKNVKPDH